MHENTLHWSSHRRDETGRFIGGGMVGRYRGVDMVAGRGTAYQFGIGDRIYTCYWTGYVGQNHEPEFRHVDTNNRYSAEFAEWFDLLANL